MEKYKLYNRINKFFDNHIFVTPVFFLDINDENFRGKVEIKFQIVGEKKLIVVGQSKNFVMVDVNILSTDNKILKLFFEQGVGFERLYGLSNSIESYLESKLDIFNIDRVKLNDVNWVGK